ncbi:hypothetical protein DTO166G4_5595 [Paecilomyces variotii]|nr:hypothetical protein DTO166G4_5595 [Paecilomyces variotii]KAJ9223002.1 hypothetical protein DTO169C6_4675 [Paecilomyces variotii]KAJ9232736.1 hypothetical protein DTO166G5_6129 [Paecilomyces variotii]KAJ9265080.1 hypothetical protein DTO195F2_2092 [Paecilomyces variotii]KAJ9303373.1 hypothetical protein DTO217A2_7164 [Paecilomyces variotii]
MALTSASSLHYYYSAVHPTTSPGHLWEWHCSLTLAFRWLVEHIFVQQIVSAVTLRQRLPRNLRSFVTTPFFRVFPLLSWIGALHQWWIWHPVHRISHLQKALLHVTFPPSSIHLETQANHHHGRLKHHHVVQSADGDDSNIESVDLTEVEDDNALSKALAKQREDAIRAQGPARDGEGRSVLTAYKCPVCMDTPVDATSTICGHLFCHKCIIDTLKFSEEQRSDSSGKGPRGNCPVCRKPLTRNDVPGPRRNLVPLTLKLMTKKRDNHQPREPQTTESI